MHCVAACDTKQVVLGHQDDFFRTHMSVDERFISSPKTCNILRMYNDWGTVAREVHASLDSLRQQEEAAKATMVRLLLLELAA